MKFVLPTIKHPIHANVKNNLFSFLGSLNPNQEHEISIVPHRKTRTAQQNKKLQAMCGAISEQVLWHGRKLTKNQWRWIFVATYFKHESVPNLEGDGFIILGQSSAGLKVKECNEVMLIAQAFGDEHGVIWPDYEKSYYQEPV